MTRWSNFQFIFESLFITKSFLGSHSNYFMAVSSSNPQWQQNPFFVKQIFMNGSFISVSNPDVPEQILSLDSMHLTAPTLWAVLCFRDHHCAHHDLPGPWGPQRFAQSALPNSAGLLCLHFIYIHFLNSCSGINMMRKMKFKAVFILVFNC